MNFSPPSWELDGRNWPNRESSLFVNAGGLRWHVQKMGVGPVVLLVHGTGAASHSWRSLAPLLAARFTVCAVDLPGHGFSGAPWQSEQMSLPAMANALATLLDVLELKPALAAAHSAGAAIVTRMCLDGRIDPQLIVSINGALLPLRGIAGILFPPAARLLASNSFFASLFADRAAERAAVERLISDTGSSIEPEGMDCYATLVRNRAHVSATLQMMARWDLRPLARDLPQLTVPIVLVVGSNDRTLSPAEAQRVRAILPGTKVVTLEGLGHLAHEERPQTFALLIEESLNLSN